MPLKIIAEEVSLYGLLRELQDLVSLEIPTEVIKEENVVASLNEESARYIIVWMLPEELNLNLDVERTVKQLAQQVLIDRTDVAIDFADTIRSKDTAQMMVTISYLEDKERTADEVIAPLVVPIIVTFQEDAYTIESPDTGTTYSVLKNGEPIEEGDPSIAYSLGKLLKYILVELSYVEELSTGHDTTDEIDTDFILSVAEWMANSPAVSADAKKALTVFSELVTNQKFEPEETEEGKALQEK